jgi:hypothetical protein
MLDGDRLGVARPHGLTSSCYCKSYAMGKFADRIRAAHNQPEAMLALAEGIDEILSALSTSPAPSPSDEWGDWAGRNAAGGVVGTAGESGSGSDPRHFDVIEVKVDPRELEEAREDEHQAEVNWERLNARGRQEGQSPQDWEQELIEARDAMQRAQGRRRLLEDPGSIVQNAGFIEGTGEVTRTVETADGQLVVDLPPADAQRRAARRKLAEAVGLPGFFPNIFRTGQPAEDIIHAFEVGGPIWLNANGKFEGQPPVIMQMPVMVRRAMVEDVKQDSPRLAHEFAREVLKDYDELGNLSATGDNIDRVTEWGGQPYTGVGDN